MDIGCVPRGEPQRKKPGAESRGSFAPRAGCPVRVRRVQGSRFGRVACRVLLSYVCVACRVHARVGRVACREPGSRGSRAAVRKRRQRRVLLAKSIFRAHGGSTQFLHINKAVKLDTNPTLPKTLKNYKNPQRFETAHPGAVFCCSAVYFF